MLLHNLLITNSLSKSHRPALDPPNSACALHTWMLYIESAISLADMENLRTLEIAILCLL